MTLTKHTRHGNAQRTRHGSLAASLLVVMLTLLLVAAPCWAEEDEGSAWDVPLQACDVLIVRPVGFASLLAGTSLFAIAGPIGATYGQFDELWDLYVEDRFEFTFRRPLGDFETL